MRDKDSFHEDQKMKLSTSNCRSRSKPAVNRPFSEVGLPEELTTLPEALGHRVPCVFPLA